MAKDTRRANSRVRKVLTYSLAGLVALIVIAAATIAIAGPAYRAKFLGAWGYEHLTTLNQKVAMINNSVLGTTGVELMVGSDLTPVPYVSEMVGVEQTAPAVALSLSEGKTKTSLTPNADGTWTYVSKDYPIKLTITSETVSGGPLTSVRLRVRAEASK